MNPYLRNLAICIGAGWVALGVLGGLLLGFPDLSNPGDLAGYLFVTLFFGAMPGGLAYTIYWRAKHLAGWGIPREQRRSILWIALIIVAVVILFSLLLRS